MIDQKQIFEACLEVNTEKLADAQFHPARAGFGWVSARDLREMLFRFTDDSMIAITNELCYRLLVNHGILINGFRPDKTYLRHRMKLSIEEINEIIPGAFKATVPGPRKGVKYGRK